MREFAQSNPSSARRCIKALYSLALPLLIITLVGGCPKKKAGSGSGSGEQVKPAASLVSKTHLAKLERELLARATQNKTKRCSRPLLQGDALEGPADKDQLALIKPDAKGSLSGCLAATTKHKEELKAAVKKPGPLPAPLKQLLTACDGLGAAIERAVRHEDACSPYLPGRRGLDDLKLLVGWGRVIALRVRVSAGANAIKDARLALETLRLSQDLARGGGSLVSAMVGAVMAETVLLSGLKPLLDGGGLSAAQLDELDRMLEALEKSEPPFGPIARDLNDAGTLQQVLPLLKGRGWAPPGGFDHDFRPNYDKGKESGIKTRTIKGLTDDERMGLVWIAGHESSQQIAAACPVDASAQSCWRGLVKAQTAADKEKELSPLKRVMRYLTVKDKKSERVRQLIDILKGVAVPDYSKYVGKYAVRAFHLRAVRLQVRLLRQKTAKKPCPSAKTLLQGAEKMGIDPATGKPLQLEQDKDSIVIRPSSKEADAQVPKTYAEQTYRVSCPK